MAIIQGENVIDNFQFAKNVKGADVKAHGRIIITKGTSENNLEFAREIEGADVASHEKIVLQKGTPEECYKFAKHVSGANIKALGQVVLTKGNVILNYLFAKNIKGADVKAHKKVVLERIKEIGSLAGQIEVLEFFKDVPEIDEKLNQTLEERKEILKQIKDLERHIQILNKTVKKYILDKSDNNITAIFYKVDAVDEIENDLESKNPYSLVMSSNKAWRRN